MGLDNGFLVVSDKRLFRREDLPQGIDYPFSSDYCQAPEIVYWRKNWGLRNAVIEYLDDAESDKGESNADAEDGYYYVDTPEQILGIVGIIFRFLDEDNWDEYGDSIWEYEEVRPSLQRDIINLILMIPFLREHPDAYLKFYDSY